MPKPALATIGEVDQLKADLEEAIDKLAAAAATKVELQNSATELGNELKALSDLVDKNRSAAEQAAERVESDSKQYTDDTASRLTASFEQHLAEAEAARKKTEDAAEDGRARTEAALRQTIDDEIASLRQAAFDELGALRKELAASVAQLRQEAVDEEARLKADIKVSVAKQCQDVVDEVDSKLARANAEFERYKREQKALDDAQDANAARSRGEVDARLDSLQGCQDEDRVFLLDSVTFTRKEAAAHLDDARSDLEEHLSVLDREASNLWDSFREVQELPTRRVEWILPGASQLLRLAATTAKGGMPYTSWFSPRFRAAGTRNLRIELRIYRKVAEGSFASAAIPGGPGDCSLIFWCGRGMHMHIRLFIGGKGGILERYFAERSGCGTKKLCFLKESIHEEDDTLHVGVELLEAISEIDGSSPMLRAGDGDEDGVELNDAGDADALEAVAADEAELMRQSKDLERQLAAAREEVARIRAEAAEAVKGSAAQVRLERKAEESEKPIARRKQEFEAHFAAKRSTFDKRRETAAKSEGSLSFHRHVNHRLVHQMKTEVERMQARMVRRVEWHVEQASILPSYFRHREPVCSTVFGAAGVEGMQLVFYPSGYSGASDGFCSCYLYCPAGVQLKCTLSVGKETRDANHFFEEAGAYGRANFCRFEGCYDDALDVVVIAFEITDIQQHISAASRHPAGSRTVDSSLKMLKAPGRNALVETKLLPSLWTAKALGEQGARPDGYNEMADLKTRRAAPEGSNPFRPAGTQSIVFEKKPRSSPAVQRSESTPAFHATTRSGGASAAASQPPSPPGTAGPDGSDFSGAVSDRGRTPVLPSLTTPHGGDAGQVTSLGRNPGSTRSSRCGATAISAAQVEETDGIFTLPLYMHGLT